MKADSKIFVAGGTGLVGSALIRKLLEKGYRNVVASMHSRPSFRIPGAEDRLRFVPIDLLDQNAVRAFFEKERPEIVLFAAAKVGGIMANNSYRAEFIHNNLQIQTNVIHQSYLSGVKKLMFLGSSCIYPRNCPQPMNEESLLTGELEYTNEPYAVAKIAGMKMCESYNLQYGTNYISLMPTNLYGPLDNYDLETSHVLPALMRKMYLAKLFAAGDFAGIRNDFARSGVQWQGKRLFGGAVKSLTLSEKDVRDLLAHYQIGPGSVTLWGSGEPKREFLYSDDLADACVTLMQTVDFPDLVALRQKAGLGNQIRNTHVNIGAGKDISIKELALLIQDTLAYDGEIVWDRSKPDGTTQKLLDTSRLKSLGWEARISLREGLKRTFQAYVSESPIA